MCFGEDSEDSDHQSVRMPRLIPAFTGHTGHFTGFVMLRLISNKFFLPTENKFSLIPIKHYNMVVKSCGYICVKDIYLDPSLEETLT